MFKEVFGEDFGFLNSKKCLASQALFPRFGNDPARPLSFSPPAPHYPFHEEPGELQDVTQVRGTRIHDENR